MYLGLLLASIVVNYSFSILIDRWRNQAPVKIFLILAITSNLALLAYFKYSNFFISTANYIGGSSLNLLDIVLPLGISFFTFTQIAFLVDVYRGIAREYNFVYYLLFVTYFPHLIAGPVLHHGQMMPQFNKTETYQLQPSFIAMGFSIFTVGLAKKVLLADSFGDYAEPIFGAAGEGVQLDLIEGWTGALAYTMQLYFDFSGYSDMAIGISMLFGIMLPINFNSPYKALSIIDFWRRWHITLSKFLLEYLYIPLGGNRNGKILRYVNLMVTMILGGLWHGASWTFVIWGGLHGFYLAVNHAWRSITKGLLPSRGISAFLYKLMAGILTFLCVVIAWIFFRAETFESAVLILKGCFGYGGVSLPSKFSVISDLFSTWSWISYNGVFLNIPSMGSFGGLAPFVGLLIIGMSIIWLAPNCQQFFNYAEHDHQIKIPKEKFIWRPLPIVGFIFGCVFCFVISRLDRVSTFLYYQF
jgi:alginate O-acetyltransferase complex protein AlgI